MIKQWKSLQGNKGKQVGQVMAHPLACLSSQPYLLSLFTSCSTAVLQEYSFAHIILSPEQLSHTLE